MKRQLTHDAEYPASVDPSSSEATKTVKQLSDLGFDFYVARRLPGEELRLKRREGGS